ncbi:hypothetical protein G9A89_000605, partial [Geosiphon pyriformis]
MQLNYPLGKTYPRSIEEQETLAGLTRNDLSQARFYKICDDAGGPKYLWDKLLAALKEEMAAGYLAVGSGVITQRNAFFSRVHKTLCISPPEEVEIQLSNGDLVTVQRFNFKEQLQRLLVSRVYLDLDNIDLANTQHPWTSSFPDGYLPTHTSLVDSTWYHGTSRT